MNLTTQNEVTQTVIPTNGDLTLAPGEALLALGHAWEIKAEKSSGEARISLLNHAQLCFQVAYERGVAGAFGDLAKFVGKYRDEGYIIELCNQALANRHPVELRSALRLFKGPSERVTKYLRRLEHQHHVNVDLPLARNLAASQPNRAQQDEIWFRFRRSLQNAKRFYHQQLRSVSGDENTFESLDQAANAYLNVLDEAVQLLKGIIPADQLVGLHHARVKLAASPPLLERWSKTDSILHEHAPALFYYVNSWREHLRESGISHQRVQEHLMVDVKAGVDGLWIGVMANCIKNSDRTGAAHALNSAVKVGIKYAGKNFRFWFLNSTERPDDSDNRYMFETCVEAAEYGNPEDLYDLADSLISWIDVDYGLAYLALKKAVEHGLPVPPEQLAAYAVMESIVQKGQLSPDDTTEIMNKCEKTVSIFSVRSPDFARKFYVTLAEKLAKVPLLKNLETDSDARRDLKVLVFQKTAASLFSYALGGDCEAIRDYTQQVSCLSHIRNLDLGLYDATSFNENIARVLLANQNIALEIVQKNPAAALSLLELCSVGSKWAPNPQDLSSDGSAQENYFVELGSLIAKKAYEIDPANPDVITAYVSDLDANSNYEAILTVMNSVADRPELVTGIAFHKLANAVSKLGRGHENFDTIALWGSRADRGKSAEPVIDQDMVIHFWADVLRRRDLPLPTRPLAIETGELPANDTTLAIESPGPKITLGL